MLTADCTAALDAVSCLASRPEEMQQGASPSWATRQVLKVAMPAWELVNDSQGTTASWLAREQSYQAPDGEGGRPGVRSGPASAASDIVEWASAVRSGEKRLRDCRVQHRYFLDDSLSDQYCASDPGLYHYPRRREFLEEASYLLEFWDEHYASETKVEVVWACEMPRHLQSESVAHVLADTSAATLTTPGSMPDVEGFVYIETSKGVEKRKALVAFQVSWMDDPLLTGPCPDRYRRGFHSPDPRALAQHERTHPRRRYVLRTVHPRHSEWYQYEADWEFDWSIDRWAAEVNAEDGSWHLPLHSRKS